MEEREEHFAEFREERPVVRSTSSPRRPAIRSLAALVRLGGQDFTFKLSTRPLVLGHAATVQYYWLDSRQFRHLSTAAAADNFRACLGHWAAAMRALGLANDLEQQIHYVTALCYAEVCNRKSLQEIYRDAYLAPRAAKLDHPLPRGVSTRIRDIVTSQDRFRVQEELDGVLGGFEPPGRVLPLLQEAFRRWVGKGVVLMRERGNEGLKQFLGEVNYWLSTYRKRSGRWVRHFINLFAYEAKVSFYRCYANAWIKLIPWLGKNHSLDQVSERFLRFWHHQNQPIEIPHGRTIGGIYYPTHGRATVVERGRDGRAVPRSLTWKNPQVGPTHVQDVFRGQVLSLHPLSGFFMQDPKACAIAGKFFTSDRYEDVMVRGNVKSCPEYWDLIGAILAAAHRYRQAVDEQGERRRVRPNRSGALATLACPAEEYSVATLLEDFAAHRKVRCPKCADTLRLERYQPAEDGDPGRADYRCRARHQLVTIEFTRSDLERFWRGSDA